MEGFKPVNPTITNWAIILSDTLIAVLCLAVSNVFMASGNAADGSTLYFATIACSCLVGSMWVKPLVDVPGTRFYRIMERTFHKVLLTGLLAMSALFFCTEAPILRTLTATFLLVFFAVLLLVRVAEHTYFKRCFARAVAREGAVEAMPRGLYYVWNRMVKRIFDILLSLIFLLTIYPPVYIAVFVYSKFTQRGAVYSTKRLTGLNGKEFSCIIFRALGPDTFLNTFPRLFSVLTGDMSIVGTRCYPPAGSEPDEEPTGEEGKPFIGKPGLTGWATLEGFRDREEEKMLDNWYAGNWSFGLDVFIILKGLCRPVFKKKGTNNNTTI